ncbi:hypothetical protein PLESTM_001784900 [Pleodorina starrii]|nr:hypothetical protein PLESTM_001784900 [Pleodorina starrii]
MDDNGADIKAESESDTGVNSMADCKAEPAEMPGEAGPHGDGQGVPLAGGEGITLVKRAGQPLSSLEFVALGLELSQRIPPWAVQGVLFQLWLPFLSICRDVFGTLLSESHLERLLVPVFEMAGWEAPLQIPGLSDAGFNIWANSHMHVVFFLAIAIEKPASLSPGICRGASHPAISNTGTSRRSNWLSLSKVPKTSRQMLKNGNHA